MKTFIKIIFLILIFALIVGLIVFLVKNGDSIFKSSKLTYNDLKVDSSIILPNEDNIEIQVKYTDGFSVRIDPIISNNIDYSVSDADGNETFYKFPVGLTADWNDIFNLELTSDSFIFDNSEFTLSGVLQNLYPNSTIAVYNQPDGLKSFFQIHVIVDGVDIIIPLNWIDSSNLALSENTVVF